MLGILDWKITHSAINNDKKNTKQLIDYQKSYTIADS